ncbi:conserved hypothetical protein [[Clostridium] ultunense Esp]|uniref:hypothetical protein n=1 Tax=Thermicanus aegyptius TaxID=94009 RepID=UPI0002B70131|nr:hypothetical protein [Thermicanus aegyptius]CCQ97277.1 conserved hypothetical protein [[Clostridium] ultunense Esp]
MKKAFEFRYDREIGIEIPEIHVPVAELSETERNEFLHRLEQISGQIPDRIRELEHSFTKLYDQSTEQDGDGFFERMEKIVDLSRRIGELNIWYLRIQGKHLTPFYSK